MASICGAAGFKFAIHRTDHPPETALLACTPRWPHDDFSRIYPGSRPDLPRSREGRDDLRRPLGPLALLALPLLWWLLRVTPPAPRCEILPGDPLAARA